MAQYRHLLSGVLELLLAHLSYQGTHSHTRSSHHLFLLPPTLTYACNNVQKHCTPEKLVRLQLWEGLALVLRVSEVQLTIQGTRSTHPHQRTYPGRGSHSPGWVSLGTVWGEGWG